MLQDSIRKISINAADKIKGEVYTKLITNQLSTSNIYEFRLSAVDEQNFIKMRINGFDSLYERYHIPLYYEEKKITGSDKKRLVDWTISHVSCPILTGVLRNEFPDIVVENYLNAMSKNTYSFIFRRNY